MHSPSLSIAAREALKTLVQTLEESIEYPDDSPVKLVIYFDEAHELLVNRNIRARGTRFDILCSALDAFVNDPMMAVFMSTEDLERSTQMAKGMTTRHGPITGLPFDCHPSFPLNPSNYSLDDLGELEFLAMFGRPLYA